jgi:hypothetical protein
MLRTMATIDIPARAARDTPDGPCRRATASRAQRAAGHGIVNGHPMDWLRRCPSSHLRADLTPETGRRAVGREGPRNETASRRVTWNFLPSRYRTAPTLGSTRQSAKTGNGSGQRGRTRHRVDVRPAPCLYPPDLWRGLAYSDYDLVPVALTHREIPQRWHPMKRF